MNFITRRTAAIAGIVLGPLWLGTVALITWAEYDFLRSLGWTLTQSHDIPYPSATSRGDFGVVQIVNFALAGLLGGIFLVGFRREFRRTVAGRVATFGLGLFTVAGALNACPTDLPGEPATWHGTAHQIGFMVTMLSILIGFSASGLALRDNPDWRGWRLLGFTPVLLLLIAFTGLGLPGDTSWYVFLVIAFGWFAAMGVRLLQVQRFSTEREPSPAMAQAAAPGLL